MKHSRLTHHRQKTNAGPQQKAKTYLLSLAVPGAITGLAFAVNIDLSPFFLAVTGIFLLITIPVIISNFSAAIQHRDRLQAFARRIGFICHVGSPLFGYPVHLTGHYRRRAVTISHRREGNYFPKTRLELTVNNLSNDTLRLRGPIIDQADLPADPVAADMVAAAGHRQVGHDGRFLLRGPIHLTANLLASGTALEEKMRLLKRAVNIELEKNKIYFEHPGLVSDPDYLRLILDLSSDLADAIDRKGSARSRLLAATAA